MKNKIYKIIKRFQDILLATVASVLLLPLMLLFMLIVYIDDPKGSPLFKQKRCGLNGKEFTLYKLRTMCVDAEDVLDDILQQNEMQGIAFKMKDDPRITKVGKFFRKSGLDELPQLWNIVKGDMSLVGPRPPLPREVEQYDDYYKQRLSVIPGLTCYWQIQDNRNSITFDEWVELDLKYIKERSFLTDWKIIFKTVGTVVKRQGQ